MTDNEIVKALECCYGGINEDCENCPNRNTCIDKVDVVEMVVDLINRQKVEIEKLKSKNSNQKSNLISLQNDLTSAKAEIERLKTSLNIDLENYASEYDGKIKAEAYREFAERLKERMLDFARIGINEHLYYLVGSKFFDNLLKELVGEDDV